jgi:nucleoside-diphosphate-sugar epimerase
MDTVLVTGGAGFIGSNLAEGLVKRGFDVRILDDFSAGKKENLDAVRGKAEIIRGSITDMETARKALKGIDCIFHQAALTSVTRSVEKPLETAQVNIIGTLNLLVSARDAGVRRVVFASSSSIYGNTPTLPKREDMPPCPQSPYALTKYAGERYMQIFHSLYGLETVSLRYFNVFGPRQDPNSQYAAVIPKFITAVLAGKKPVIDGDGEQTRDFTYIKDTVEANILAMQTRKGIGEVFNIAGGKRITINGLKSLICELSGKDVGAVHGPPRPGDVRHSLADTDRARRLLGYEPKYDVRKGLEETIRWYGNELR